MSITKNNFKTGDILYALSMNQIESHLYDAEQIIKAFQAASGIKDICFISGTAVANNNFTPSVIKSNISITSGNTVGWRLDCESGIFKDDRVIVYKYRSGQQQYIQTQAKFYNINTQYYATMNSDGQAVSFFNDIVGDGTYQLIVWIANDANANINLDKKMNINNPVGIGTIAVGDGNVKVTGDYSQAFGQSTTASAQASNAFGYKTTASGAYSHSQGNTSTASAKSSHAEGTKNTSSGQSSHAQGNTTTAAGDSSHSQGLGTIANSEAAHAEGYYTIASSNIQHVEGKYNKSDAQSTYAHIVGNGKSDKKRSNAHTLDWNGNAQFAGDVYASACGGDDPISLIDTSESIYKVVTLLKQLRATLAKEDIDEAIALLDTFLLDFGVMS